MLIVLTGKTASGKDTIKLAILSKYPNLRKVITTTSRKLRNGESDGVDYHFLTRDRFQEKIRNGDFAEHVEYGGNLYGTYKKELERAQNSDVLWRIDPSRAGKIKEFLQEQNLSILPKVIYITVSDDVVLERLKKRGLSEEEIQKRMDDDAKIWNQYKNNYDYVVENVPGKLNETIDKIINIIENHKQTITKPL